MNRPRLSRRVLLLGCAAAAVGCAEAKALEEMPKNSFMWGSTQRLAWNNADAQTYFGLVSPQIVAVAHEQPETWSFLLHLHVNALTAGATQNAVIAWDLIIGLGRSQVTIRNWTTMGIDPNVVDPVTGLPPDQFLTEIPAYPLGASLGPCRQFPAQTIQIVARALSPTIDPGINYDVSLSAFVSPVALGVHR